MANPPLSHDDTLTESEISKPPSAFEFLIPLVEEIPLGQQDAEVGRSRALMFRGAMLLAVAFLVYLPCFWGTLLDGERDRLTHLATPDVPYRSFQQLTSWFELGHRVPNLLRWLIYAQHGPEGSSPLFEVTGVLLHLCSVIFLWLVLRRLTLHAAWLAALIFAIHPTNASAVAWVSQQGRLWSTLFSLIGLLLILKNRNVPAEANPDLLDYLGEETHRGWLNFRKTLSYTGALLAFLAAAFCQPTAAIMPVIAVVLIRWKKRMNLTDKVLLAPPAFLGAAAGTLLIYKALTHHATRNTLITSAFMANSLLPAGRILVDFLLLHSPHSPWIDASPTALYIAAVVGGICFISIPILFILRRKLGSAAFVSVLLFVLLVPTAIAPVAVHSSGQTLQGIENPGEGYLAHIPLLVLLATGLLKLSVPIRADLAQSAVQVLASLVIAILLGFPTSFAAGAFDSTADLLKSNVYANANSPAARSRLAEYYLAQSTPDRFQLAEDQLRDVHLETCHDAATAVAMGDLLQAQGQLDTAARWYQRGQAVDSTTSDPAAHLAALYVRQNRSDEAQACYEQAIQQHPDAPSLRNDLGLLLNATKRPDPALEQFYKALEIDPDYVPAHVNLANALITRGKLADAAQELQSVIALDPENFEAFHNAGFVLAQLHDYDRALPMLTIAVQLKPDSPQARNDLGVVLVAAGKYNRAIFELEQAITQAPNYSAAEHNLDIAKRRLAAQKSETAAHTAAKPLSGS